MKTGDKIEAGDMIDVLDHGYVKFISSMGTDETIIEAARMSTGRGFEGWGPKCANCGDSFDAPERDCPVPGGRPYVDCGRGGHMFTASGDEKLLAFLWKNKHATPFEMCELHIEVMAPIFVFREWHRHRTQCLRGDVPVTFELPQRTKKGKHGPYLLTMRQLWERWQPTERTVRPERQTNALWPRSRVQAMPLRVLNEETGDFTTSRVLDVVKGEPKPLYTVTTVGGKETTTSADHAYFTSDGWKQLKEFASLPTETDPSWSTRMQLTVGMTAREKASTWTPPIFDSAEEIWKPVLGWEGLYEVSNTGRVRRVAPARGASVGEPRVGTVGAQGYLVISLSRGSKTFLYTVHTLVLEAFIGPRPPGQETRHADHNRQNPRLYNLSWGTSKENSADMVAADRQQRLVSGYEEIVNIRWAGVEETYDLVVEGPWHNFVAGGIVVHNSYNEMSARYTPLPDVNYVPTVERLLINSKTNKQAGTIAKAKDLDEANAEAFRRELVTIYGAAETLYQEALAAGVPKELARVHLPVGRYSKMRAKTDLRNWLGFLTLRMAPGAQWEIRQYANAVAEIVKTCWPRTYALFATEAKP